MYKLWDKGVRGRMWSYIDALYSRSTRQVRVGVALSDAVDIDMGVAHAGGYLVVYSIRFLCHEPGQAKGSVQQAATDHAGVASSAAAAGIDAGAGCGDGDEPAKPLEQGGQCQAAGKSTDTQGGQAGGQAPDRVPRVWELLEKQQQQQQHSGSSSPPGPRAAPQAVSPSQQPAGHRLASGPLAPYQPHAAYPSRPAAAQRSSGAAGRSTYPAGTQHHGSDGAAWRSAYHISDLHSAGGLVTRGVPGYEMHAWPQDMSHMYGRGGPAGGRQGQQSGPTGWRQHAAGWQQPPRPGSAWY
jgi:hypothetical protein